jgi:hypothetical protein
MDQAFTKAAEAGSQALKELASKSKDFSGQDFKQALEQMKRMESDFVETLRQVAATTHGVVRSGWDDLLSHAQRTGTDTGKVISETTREFSQRMASGMSEGAAAGMEAARQFGERFAAAASGFFAGMSEALKSDRDKPSK